MIKMLTDCGIPDYFFTRAVKQIKIQIFIVKMEKKSAYLIYFACLNTPFLPLVYYHYPLK